jgi:hypothetical protein
MRLWSLHPTQLDAQGLVAVWREGLLAQKVLRGKTHGYKHHPQLDRFRAVEDPVSAVGAYLSTIFREAKRRGYSFNQGRIVRYAPRIGARVPVTRGQVRYEWEHLLAKLRVRDRSRYQALRRETPKIHPLFRVVAGPVATWERIPQ